MFYYIFGGVKLFSTFVLPSAAPSLVSCFFNDSLTFFGGKVFSSMILTLSAAHDFFWHDCAAFGAAKIRKRRRMNFHKKRSFSHLGSDATMGKAKEINAHKK